MVRTSTVHGLRRQSLHGVKLRLCSRLSGRRTVQLEEMSGPNRVAAQVRDDIDAANAELESWPDRGRRRELNKRIHRLKALLKFCESRAGYVAPG
jgi:hypothetical protein